MALSNIALVLQLQLFVLVVIPKNHHHYYFFSHGFSIITKPSLTVSTCNSSNSMTSICSPIRGRKEQKLLSSFYNDFEDFERNDDNDDDDDDDEEDEYIDLDEKAFANFKAKMGVDTSNLYEDIDEDDDEEDDDDDDEEGNLNIDESISSQSFSTVDDLINFATSSSSSSSSESGNTSIASPSKDWANPLIPLEENSISNNNIDLSEILKGGVVLIANPNKFFDDFYYSPSTTATSENEGIRMPSPALLTKFGLTLPPPNEIGPDRRADLLPVLVLLERHPLRGCQALLMNRRTGYLIGDLEQSNASQQFDDDDNNNNDDYLSSTPPLPPQLGAFMIQPLWFGGTSNSGSNVEQSQSRGLEMLHICPNVDNAIQLTNDGLYWGGDPIQAQEAMNDPSLDRIYSGFDFKFFVQSTRWLPLQLEKEIRDGTWMVADVSKDVLFKSRDRLGEKRAKPLWTEIMELMGGNFKEMVEQLYEE